MAGVCLSLVACAATTGGSGAAARYTAPSQGASVQAVTQSFVDAVTEYCVRHVLLEEAVAAISEANPRLSSLSEASGRRAMMRVLDRAWVLDDSGDIVMLDVADDGTACRVNAYGPPARATIAVTAQIVQAMWDGEPIAVEPDPSPLVIDRRVRLHRNGRTVDVYIGGNEPGAPGRMSRFSTLSASVSLRDPDQPS